MLFPLLSRRLFLTVYLSSFCYTEVKAADWASPSSWARTATTCAWLHCSTRVSKSTMRLLLKKPYLRTQTRVLFRALITTP